MTILLPSLTIEEVAIERLTPDPANPRRISDDELEALTRSLRQFGFVQPVLARRENGVVVGGHQRLVAARRLGLASVPVVWLDVSVEQAHLLGLALNKVSGSWDDQLLARLLADLQESGGLDVSLSGFGDDEVAGLVRRLEGPRAARASGDVRSRRRPRGCPTRTADEDGRAVGAGRPPAPVRRRHRGRGCGSPRGGSASGHGLHRSALQRQPR